MKKNILLKFVILFFLFLFLISSGFSQNENSPIQAKTNQEITQSCGGGINIRDSFIFSVISGCIPGVLEKTYEYRQNKCQTVVCYYEAVSNGLDPSFCMKQDAYQTCTLFVGELFAISPLGIIEYYKNAMVQVLANPVGILWSIGLTTSREIIAGICTVPNACTWTNPSFALPAVFVVATDSIALAQMFEDIQENGFVPPGIDRERRFCEELPEIKEEMDNILNIMRSRS